MKITKQKVKLFFALVFLVLIGCKKTVESKQNNEKTVQINVNLEEELYRPNFHFSPKKAWMNDPNGMFYFNGTYHLYFQYHPSSNVWGPMHWGQATSTDMVNWEEQPIAIYPDSLGTIFSGSAVVDLSNTSGFSKTDSGAPVVAIYTSSKQIEGTDNWNQTQSIAYSNDQGMTFTKYENNPVLDNNGLSDFRDPKVFWNEEKNQWVMALAAGDRIMFFKSENLKQWDFLSDFGKGKGAHGGVWECPDLIKLPVIGTEESKWVLFVSINPGGPNGGSATQYFVGDFNGTTFTMDKDFEESLNKNHNYWIDFGRDNYAGVTWSNISKKDGGKLMIGWMSNWQYAQKVPTETWRSTMTVARKVRLQKNQSGYRLIFNPVSELSNYRITKLKKEHFSVIEPTEILTSEIIDLARSEIHFNLLEGNKKTFTFKVSNSLGNTLLFGYNHEEEQFFINRKKSGNTGFSEAFADRITYAPRTSKSEHINGTILLDKTSIELFFDDGETTMTEIFFPEKPFTYLTIEPQNNPVILERFEAYEINLNGND